VSLVSVMCFQALRRADHSSRGVLPSAVCLFECDCGASIMWRPWPTRDFCATGKRNIYLSEY
jgi:hypothetical protein